MILKQYWFWIVSILSLVAIIAALIAELIFNLEPCSMCLKQRHPYYFIIITFIIFALLKWQKKIWFYVGVQLASIYGLFYAFWHVGIENKILPGPSECSAELKLSNNVSELKDQIMSKPVISCEEVIWSFFGISAATINTFIVLAIFIINAIYLYKLYGSKKTKTI
tara:strand:- start:367 stop:864 length:498 start_codon:yes stop_codon:yes gene_type:complete